MRAALARKISDAYRAAVDSHPVTRGMPLEFELRYQYNYHYPDREISFEAFLSALSRDLSPQFPGLQISPDWVRRCDALGRREAARRAMQRLRDSVEKGRYFRTSFWDMLWTLTEVSMQRFGLSCAEIGTDPLEIHTLARRYLLRECSLRVEALKVIDRRQASPAAKRIFVLVDDMMRGIPIPAEELCRNRHTYYSPNAAYTAYRNVADGNTIAPREVGWSKAEHLAWCEALFPDGRIEETRSPSRSDPTAPATALLAERIDPEASLPDRVVARIAADPAPAAAPARPLPEFCLTTLGTLFSWSPLPLSPT